MVEAATQIESQKLYLQRMSLFYVGEYANNRKLELGLWRKLIDN